MDPILEEADDVISIEDDPADMKMEGKGKKGNKRSEVWDHFKIRGDEKAECNYCGQTYKHHAKNCGTSTLWNHITQLCKRYPYRGQDKKQKRMTGYSMYTTGELSKGVGSRNEPVNFVQKEVREQITRYFILSELPFRHVEDEGFQYYTRYFFPKFVFPSRMTVARDIYNMFLNEKKKLQKELGQHRVSLTTDCWTSIQNVSYLCLTAHWVDNDWRLQKRIISFIQVPSHKGDMVGKELVSCLKDWGINKIFCVTVDNASSNDIALLRLKSCFEEKKNGLVLGGEMLHMRCCAHILNLIVCDGLKEINHAISAIRNAVRFVRSSPERLKRFKESCKEASIESRALLCLDVTTRWNSTYLMLQAAMKFKKAFLVLEGDGNYTNYFNEDRSDGRNLNGPPTRVDWDRAEVFVRFLGTFYEMTLKFSGSNYVTSNSFFQEICEIHAELNELGKEPNTLMGSMAVSMRKKYDKYWGNVEKFNQMLFIATILDPRYKLELLKIGFELIYDVEIAKSLLKRVQETLHRLYAFYEEIATPVNSPSVSSKETTKSSSETPSPPDLGLSKPIHSIFKARLMQNIQSEKNDLVAYLSDRCENLNDPNFDILLWWKLNAHKYKIVSQIAKDVLAIQISTVASESAFSTSGRILDSFRSSLGAKMVEALICTKNWLHSNKEPIVLRQYLDEVEALDDSEKAVEEAESCITTGDIDPIIIK